MQTTQAMTIADKLQTIAQRLEELEQQTSDLQAQIAALDSAGICTGTAYWRDGNNGHEPKLYANHSVDRPCPIHGQPAPGKRIRAYVGTDPDRQAEALAAIERLEEKTELESHTRQIEAQIRRIEQAINDAYYAATGNQQRWEWRR